MIEKQDGDFAHRYGEDKEPTPERDEEESGRENSIEEQEEDNSAEIPLSTAKQSSLAPCCIGMIQVGTTIPS